ncbi:hypothetical protein RR46_05347 [Papilio xuthus]|uniref:Uncharacterized protein n=1 Tax=Papilio xuthus TaxID=66420 RepID=A0A194Q6C5_PAPXU|nr:hypothetical protein RR46_05347 [Papilio xuthus]
MSAGEECRRTVVVALQEEALARAHERAMERYVERREELGWRPHLGQRIADYHLGLLMHVGELALLPHLPAILMSHGCGHR